MRIGVLLIGQTRQFEVTAQHMMNEFKMDGVEVDYFCHTWDSIVNFSPWNNVTSIDDRFSDVKKVDKKTNNRQTKSLFSKSNTHRQL